ncbi:hypothetical protein TNCV_2636801 [Trichonephila clavipes]|uniref:Uncharacterized protein n=1 Tax=Trichonephila clavipes TaxID=2585209 RepID=A0A8X6R3U3_TRICX|nr:hypothetical protein TNCV_2636801 [Trichonephila clavipes]
MSRDPGGHGIGLPLSVHRPAIFSRFQILVLCTPFTLYSTSDDPLEPRQMMPNDPILPTDDIRSEPLGILCSKEVPSKKLDL